MVLILWKECVKKNYKKVFVLINVIKALSISEYNEHMNIQINYLLLKKYRENKESWCFSLLEEIKATDGNLENMTKDEKEKLPFSNYLIEWLTANYTNISPALYNLKSMYKTNTVKSYKILSNNFIGLIHYIIALVSDQNNYKKTIFYIYW